MCVLILKNGASYEFVHQIKKYIQTSLFSSICTHKTLGSHEASPPPPLSIRLPLPSITERQGCQTTNPLWDQVTSHHNSSMTPSSGYSPCYHFKEGRKNIFFVFTLSSIVMYGILKICTFHFLKVP